MCSNCNGDYENPDVSSVKAAEIRKPWRRKTRLSQPAFATYHERLYALAERHGIPVASLKALVEDAFGTCDNPPAEQEAKQALLKLAKIKVGPSEVNWLFQVSVLKESDRAA